MEAAVERVLAERDRRSRSAFAALSLGAAAAFHAAIAILIVLGPRLMPAPEPLDYVAVQVVPAQRLGGFRAPQPHETEEPPRSAPAPPPPPPKPVPAHEEPPAPPRSNDAPVLHQPPPPPPPKKPAKPDKAKPAAPDTRIDPTTQPKVLPPPRDLLAQRLAAQAQTAPNSSAANGLPGGAAGMLNGKAAVGTTVTTLDNPEFTYDYYRTQVQARIDDSWRRPPEAPAIQAIVSFQIHKDGSISDLVIHTASPSDAFNLAAVRAVQNAAPFPPLPRAYTLNHDSVFFNVTLR